MLPGFKTLHAIATGIVRTVGRYIPYSAQKPVLSLAVNEAFREPLRNGDLDFLEGYKIRIRVEDLGIDWLFNITGERFQPIDRNQAEDVAISGNSADFALLATRRADHDTLFFQRRIRVEGDTDLGLGVKNTMDGMDWDDLPLPLRKLLQAAGIVIEKLGLDRLEPVVGDLEAMP